MNDVARLGLAIDSTQAVTGKRALDDFATSGKSAAAAAQNLQKATAGAATGASNMQKATVNAAAGARGLSNDAKNLSYQLVDVTQGLLSGQPVFQIFAQQAGQIGQVIGTSPQGLGGLTKELGSAFAGLITPARLLGVGIAATGIAAYAAYGSWKTYTLALDDAARAAGTTTQSLSALQAAASFKGISGDDFNKAISNFGRSVYDLKNNAGGLAEVFKANNTSATTFDEALEKAANLIQRARDDTQRLVLLQQMGLPPTMEWVRLLSSGADGLNKAKAAAAEFAANDNLVQKARQFDEAWNKAWTNFGINARSAFQTALQAGSSLFDKMEALANRAGNASFWKGLYDAQSAAKSGVTLLSGFDQRFTGDGANPAANNNSLQSGLNQRANAIRGQSTIDPNALRTQIALYQQYVGLLGQQASVQQVIASVEKQIQAYNLTPGAIALTDKQVETMKRLAAERALGTDQIKAQADAQRIESATIGMSVGDATAYAAAQNAINDARRAGRDLTPDNIAQIQREAQSLGQAAAQADLLRFAYNGLIQGPLQTFTSAIANGATAWDALKKAGLSALNSIASKLADMAAQKLWQAALGSGIGSLFGFSSGGIVGSGGGTGFSLTGTGGLYSDGGYTGPGGVNQPKGIVHAGEVVFSQRDVARWGGPAAVNTMRLRGYADGGIVDSGAGFRVGPASNDNRGSGGPQQLNINVNVTGARGNQEIHDMVQAGVASGLKGYVNSPQFVDHVAGARKRAGQQRK